MKKNLIAFCLFIGLYSCNTYNSKMNTLLETKKLIEDSIEIHLKESYDLKAILEKSITDRTDSVYSGKTFDEKVLIAKTEDEKVWQKVYSTNLKIKFLNERMPKILYSIDSLSKLK